MQEDYSPLLAALGTQHKSYESSPGIWTHTFTSSSSAIPQTYTVSRALVVPTLKHITITCDYAPLWDFVYTGRAPVSTAQDQARASRLMRRKQIERRQHRAAFRRRKRGLA